ncbi:hypothetical protein [Arthrobacter crystallopoietes]|uniref:hypothetical protein n=1 Tax=Crystallibacter crystallopoietes TaxID=37928 RepID=UPI00147C4F17|nr:hypothetical protein [Arthrobacter crystallopoietes]
MSALPDNSVRPGIPERYPQSTANDVPQVEDGAEQCDDKSRSADPDTGELQSV